MKPSTIVTRTSSVVGVMFAVLALSVSSALSQQPSMPQMDTDINADSSNALRKDIRKLWTDHVVWTRDFIIAATQDQPDAKAATDRLMKNQEDIGNAVAKYYGPAAGTKLTNLLKEHILIAADLVKAAKAKQIDKQAAADQKWKQNAADIADFLSSANPNWPKATLSNLLNAHLSTTADELNARLNKDWDADVKAFDAVYDHILDNVRRAERRNYQAVSGQIRLENNRVVAIVCSEASNRTFECKDEACMHRLLLNSCIALMATQTAVSQKYTVVDLGTLAGGSNSAAYGINQSGQVTGNSDTGTFNTTHAFLFSNGTMSDLGTLPGDTQSFGLAINQSGQVTGASLGLTNPRAFLFSNGSMSDLGTLPGGGYSVGQGINQSGQVTGFSEASDHNGHAFLFSNGSMSDLGTLPGGTESFGTAINQSGQVTGSATLSGGNQHAFLFSNGSMSDLGTLPGGTMKRRRCD